MKIKVFKISMISIFFLISCGKFEAIRKQHEKNAEIAAIRETAEVGDPELNFTKRCGCSDFAVYARNPNYTEIFVVRINRKDLGVTTVEKTFEIGKVSPQNIDVYVEQSSPDIAAYQRFYICDDVYYPDAPKPKHWKAINGILKIKISTDTPDPGRKEYSATVQAQNIEIQDPETGEIKVIEQFDFNEVSVGWFPG